MNEIIFLVTIDYNHNNKHLTNNYNYLANQYLMPLLTGRSVDRLTMTWSQGCIRYDSSPIRQDTLI